MNELKTLVRQTAERLQIEQENKQRLAELEKQQAKERQEEAEKIARPFVEMLREAGIDVQFRSEYGRYMFGFRFTGRAGRYSDYYDGWEKIAIVRIDLQDSRSYQFRIAAVRNGFTWIRMNEAEPEYFTDFGPMIQALMERAAEYKDPTPEYQKFLKGEI